MAEQEIESAGGEAVFFELDRLRAQRMTKLLARFARHATKSLRRSLRISMV